MIKSKKKSLNLGHLIVLFDIKTKDMEEKPISAMSNNDTLPLKSIVTCFSSLKGEKLFIQTEIGHIEETKGEKSLHVSIEHLSFFVIKANCIQIGFTHERHSSSK